MLGLMETMFRRLLFNILLPSRKSAPAERQLRPTEFAVVQSEYVEWTAADVLEWRKFLSGATGQKLIKICGANITESALRGCNDPMHTTHSAAKAAGADELFRFQFNLASNEQFSRVSGDQDTNQPANPEQNPETFAEARRF